MAKLNPKRLTVCQLFIIVLIGGCWCHQQVSAAGVVSKEDEVNETTTSTTVSSANSTPESIATSGDYGWLNEADCGRRLVRYPKIINGSTAVHGHYPWIVSLQLNNRHHCGGSLIRSDWVLTAAHCVYRMTANRFKIKVGGHRRNASAELTSVTVQPVFATAHQGFSFATFADDLALLKLPYKLKYTNYIQPICLPEFHEIPATAVVVAGANSNSTKIRLITSNNIVPQSSSTKQQNPKEATVIGWGKLKQGGFSAELLQELLVPIVDNNQCRRWYQEKAKMLAIRPTQICAGLEEGGKDACQGDSGSPMLITDPETKRSEIIGIVSAGIGCALPKLPGLYTRVSAYGRWISETIEKYDKIFPSLVTTSSTTTEAPATTTTEAPATTTTATEALTEAPSTTDQYPFPTVTFPSTIKWPVNIELAPNGTVIIPANRP